MSKDPIAAALDDARALLDTLLASDWKDAHIVSGATEIFIARDGGRANPMRAAPFAAGVADAAPHGGTSAAAEIAIKAPHVATLVRTALVGEEVEVGQVLAVLSVLDAEEPLLADRAGRVSVVHAEAGALLEFGTPILALSAAA